MREDLLVGRGIQRAADHDRAGLEAGVDVEVVDAELLQLRDVGSVDLIERREAVGGERAVVARPVGSGVLGCRLGAEARCGERQRDGRRDHVGQIGDGRLHGPSLLQAFLESRPVKTRFCEMWLARATPMRFAAPALVRAHVVGKRPGPTPGTAGAGMARRFAIGDRTRRSSST